MDTTTDAPTLDRPDGHRWETAGTAWGSRAADWACLFEHYAMDVLLAVLPRIGVHEGTRYLDIACGSGLAARLAHGAGATVAGLDAAEPLVEIARERTPEADLRVGTMFELPWSDASFDAATSINGIWGDCEGALAEAHRVLRPGGHLAISFWGTGHLDLKPCFRAFAAHAPDDHRAGMKRTNAIARPGVAEEMLRATGFDVVESGARVSVIEWPDEDTAWRAIASLGPAAPALERVGAAFLRPIVLDALADLRDPFGTYRFRNDHRFVIARKPDRAHRTSVV